MQYAQSHYIYSLVLPTEFHSQFVAKTTVKCFLAITFYANEADDKNFPFVLHSRPSERI